MYSQCSSGGYYVACAKSVYTQRQHRCFVYSERSQQRRVYVASAKVYVLKGSIGRGQVTGNEPKAYVAFSPLKYVRPRYFCAKLEWGEIVFVFFSAAGCCRG